MHKRKWLFHISLFLLLGLFSFFRSMAAIDSLPAFRIMLTKGNYFTAHDLPRNRPVLLIYFSPECEHCLHLMNELFPRMNELKGVEIILATFRPLVELPDFETRYQTAKYSNIVVGTEGTTYYLRYYFKIEKTPFIALYDKKGNLVASYKNETPVNEVVQKLKALK